MRRTYPKQIGIKPFLMKWGASEPIERGPIVVSRYSSTIRRRNGKLHGPEDLEPHKC